VPAWGGCEGAPRQPAPGEGGPGLAVRAAPRSPPVPARRGEPRPVLGACVRKCPFFSSLACVCVCVNTRGLFLSLQVGASDIPRKIPPFNSREKCSVRELPFHPFRADRRSGVRGEDVRENSVPGFPFALSSSPAEPGNVRLKAPWRWRPSPFPLR